MDSHTLIFRGQPHAGPGTRATMDNPAKRGPGRPRNITPKIIKKTAKLVPTGGEAKRIKVSISPEQESRLASLAQQDQITESEEVRRLIDAEWERRHKAGEPQK